jgi:hypothetical protein
LSLLFWGEILFRAPLCVPVVFLYHYLIESARRQYWRMATIFNKAKYRRFFPRR